MSQLETVYPVFLYCVQKTVHRPICMWVQTSL